MEQIRRRWHMRLNCLALVLLISVVAVPKPAIAQDLAEFEQRLTEFTLDNGLKFLVLERHEAPVVSFHTYANIGSVDEVKGITGLAHLFEHMAFKGTKTIGTKNHTAEVKLMARMDETFEAIKAERRKGEQADKDRVERLENGRETTRARRRRARRSA